MGIVAQRRGLVFFAVPPNQGYEMTFALSRSTVRSAATAEQPKLRTTRLRWLLLLLLLALPAAVAAVRFVQSSIVHALEAEAIEPKAIGVERPESFGVPSQDMLIPVAQRVVQARIVRAEQSQAPAVLIFHGNGEALSDWSEVQAMLYRAGVTSLVFDYSGFGNSTGKPGVESMRADALAAYAMLVRLTPRAERRLLLGHSLGNAVMLDALDDLRPAPTGVVVHAAFTSAREYAVSSGLVSPILARLLPDLWDNEEAISRSGSPVLIVHGINDEVIPVAMGRRLAVAAGSRATLMAVADDSHDEIYLGPSSKDWGPIMDFIAPQAIAGPDGSAH